MQSTPEAGVVIDNGKDEKPQRPVSRFGDAVRNWQLRRECGKIYDFQQQISKDPERAEKDRDKVVGLLEKAGSLAANDDDSWRRLLFEVNNLTERSSSPSLSTVGLDFIEKNLQHVERGIANYEDRNDKRRDFGTNAYHSLGLVLKHGSPEQVIKAAGVFKKFESRFAKEIEQITNLQITSDLVGYLLYLARQKAPDSAFFPEAEKYLDEVIYRLPSGRSSTVLRGIEANDRTLVRAYAERVVTRIVGNEKVARDMVRSWQLLVDGIDGKKMWHTDPENVAYNKARMKELEEWKPGTTRQLYDESGITWFRRYPIRALQDQINNLGEVTKPYGVIVSAYHEHNNAFGSSRFTEVLSNYYDELTKLGYNVRIVEARSKVTFTRRFVQLKAIYGEGSKCQFLIVNAHGSKKGIRLGDDGDMQIEIPDLDSGTTDFFGEIYQKGMPVIFNSCHSFAIAKALADRLNVLAHGSPIIGRLKSLQVQHSEKGSLSLVPTYADIDDKEVFASTFSNDPKDATMP